ncbi:MULTISPECIES: hypothetical protein [Methanohalobium]|uniref:Uncharacterized protein n=1 Tax=Methanohalobium evestigatum (strain ATCC BAA-1072 / DSM 3721 / NBRC 107634 / OCM 161 / Z-7303) TaxID=644295 RepID=D7EA74_METEZ|nr:MULTISPECIES: hypothetical protein [Methanohalobium]ADI74745.1 conserved hypothetical protein [Methanohalobium evestigatum Z-7303]
MQKEQCICDSCNTQLRKQVLGMNILYFCRNCGRMTSAEYV